MEKEKYNQIRAEVPDIEHYQKEVQLIEDYLQRKDILVEDMTVVFWNHVITLLERIDDNEQNDIAIEETEEISKESVELTLGLKNHVRRHRNFDLTPFEDYLLAIYFEQIKNKEN